MQKLFRGVGRNGMKLIVSRHLEREPVRPLDCPKVAWT